MNKQEILKKYNDDEKLLLSKILDKIKEIKTKNKIVHTDFLNLNEQKIAEVFLKKINENNYIMYGGIEESERKIIIFYPEKLSEIFRNNIPNAEGIINVIRIDLPNEMKGKYKHRNYLSAIIKLGVKREKIGDIIVNNDGADIIVDNTVLEFLLQELKLLKRFSKSNIFQIPVNLIRKSGQEKELITITIPSLRLDSLVSVLANVSRNKAVEIILSERVFLNYVVETKNSREVKIEDVITIRGKGRFTIKELIGESRKSKKIILIEKFK